MEIDWSWLCNWYPDTCKPPKNGGGLHNAKETDPAVITLIQSIMHADNESTALLFARALIRVLAASGRGDEALRIIKKLQTVTPLSSFNDLADLYLVAAELEAESENYDAADASMQTLERLASAQRLRYHLLRNR